MNIGSVLVVLLIVGCGIFVWHGIKTGKIK